MTAVNVRLDAIELDVSIQCRASIDTTVVHEYAEAMTDGAKFPPITLFEAGGKHYIGDGWHRVMASKQIGALDIAATVEPGGRAAALKHALAANAAHGHRRTNADKRRAVEIAIREYANLSSRAIAELCGVSPDFTARMRGEQLSSDDSSKRTGKDGKQRKAPRKPEQPTPQARPAPDTPPPAPSAPPDLETILTALEAEGKKNAATASPATVAKLVQQLRQRIDADVTARVDALLAGERAWMKAHLQKLEYREAVVQHREKKVDEWMTQDEFRRVLQCLHPDHAPEDRREKFNAAFVIFNRLQAHLSKNKRDLARNGWASYGAAPKRAAEPRRPRQNGAGDAQPAATGEEVNRASA